MDTSITIPQKRSRSTHAAWRSCENHRYYYYKYLRDRAIVTCALFCFIVKPAPYVDIKKRNITIHKKIKSQVQEHEQQ